MVRDPAAWAARRPGTLRRKVTRHWPPGCFHGDGVPGGGVDVDPAEQYVKTLRRRPGAQRPVGVAGVAAGDPVVVEEVLGGTGGGEPDPVARRDRGTLVSVLRSHQWA